MPRSFKLRISEAQSAVRDGVNVRQITISCEEPVDITPRIFVVQNVDSLPEFRTVAAASDLDNLPELEPLTADPSGYYRVASVTLSTDTPSIVDEFIRGIQRRAQALLDTLAQLDSVSLEREIYLEAREL